jgi:hypothetical protein
LVGKAEGKVDVEAGLAEGQFNLHL